MASVTFPPALGGDGSTVTDDSNPTTGLANGGHRARFVPALAQMVAVANGGVTQATAQVALATAEADAAALSEAAAAASAASAVNAPGTNATSTTSIAIGTGSKTITVQTGKNFVVGQPVMIAATAAPSTQWMAGNITAYNSGTGSLTVDVVWTRGSGTIAAWTVSLAGPANPAAVNLAGDTMTGPLAVPAGATGSQVPRASEVVGLAGLTTSEVAGTTDTIAKNQHKTLRNIAATTITGPAAATVGDRWRISVGNGRVDNVINWNGLNHEGLSDATMTITSPYASFECVYISATYGWKIT